MSDDNELLHIFTYKTKLCEARPGDPPMMTPKEGTKCPECQKRDAVWQSKFKKDKELHREQLEKLEAEWAEQDKREKRRGTGS